MRRVGCFAATSDLTIGENESDTFSLLVNVVTNWLKAKGLPQFGLGTTAFLLADGRSARLDAIEYVSRIGRKIELTLDEPTDSGRFSSRFCLGVCAGRIHLFAELRVGTDPYQIAPVHVDARCPQVIRDLFDKRKWSVGTTPIVTKATIWRERESANRFAELLSHRDRNLPVVAVSRRDGVLLVDGIADGLARDVTGLALIADIGEDVSWELTRILGREWSCYNGSIRIYWPFRKVRGQSTDHPYWTANRLLQAAESPAAAAFRFRNQLRKRFFELSTFAVDESAELVALRSEVEKERFEAAKREAEAKGSEAELADHYFNESLRLESENTKLREEKALLADQVANLSVVWKHTEGTSTEDIEPEPDEPIETVADAIERARLKLSDALTFGSDVDASVAGLDDDAGPPDKIFTYLETLAEMTAANRKGTLGKDVIPWLIEHGAKASRESETVLNSALERRRRTWNDGQGDRPFELHLKPADGTSPNRCVRIYFEYDEQRRKTIVGYVGRHL